MSFKSDNRALYNTAGANLKKDIKDAKLVYMRNIGDHFSGNNIRQVWQHNANLKGSTTTGCNTSAPLAKELNCFFAHFESKSPLQNKSLPETGNQTRTIQEHEVREEFSEFSKSEKSCRP